jgi:hypothetical protein
MKWEFTSWGKLFMLNIFEHKRDEAKEEWRK